MRHYFLGLLAVLILTTGCASTTSIHEKHDLVTIAHNSSSAYTLIIYRNDEGMVRKVLRRDGVFELLLLETERGDFLLKERGLEPRRLSARNVIDLEISLQELIYDSSALGGELPGD